MNRLHNLDYLRGIAAFGIMIFHYSTWTFGSFNSDSFIGRIGIYGVSIFYVLSGLTLFYVYQHRMKPSIPDLRDFGKKRIFRIFPLLWLATFASIIISREIPDWQNLVLNLTGLFGLINWDEYFAVGAWSIGNELVFYLFLPFFILFLKKSKITFIIISIIIFFIYLFFAFYLLDENVKLADQWHYYVNPLNQLFLFLGGFLIGVIFQDIKTRNMFSILCILLGIGIFIFYPINGDQINLVTGFNRILFTVICFMLCFGFYKLGFNTPGWIDKPFSLLGEASYSVYLLHPIIYKIVAIVLSVFSKYLLDIPKVVGMIISIGATLFFSYFVYQYFEKYFMKLGKKKFSTNYSDKILVGRNN